MAKQSGNVTNFALGIADSNKMGTAGMCRFTRGFDFRSDPAQMSVLPRTTLISGTVVKDLLMNHERVVDNDYFYGNSGRMYKLTSGVITQEHLSANSRGNGMAYLGEDRNLYYAQNTTIGRYGPIDYGTASWRDDYLGSIGGEPTNTNSLVLNGTTQYASITDAGQTGLDITGNLVLEAYAKLDTLPTALEKQTLISKWNENGNQRAYKLEIVPTANAFGDGSDGDLTISSNTTETVIDANFSATAGVSAITVSNVTGTFVANQRVLLHQTRGTNAGINEYKTIASVSGTTLTFTEQLDNTYTHSATTSVANKAQIRVVKQYNNVTINTGVTWTAKSWDGLKGGILDFFCSGTLGGLGTISADEKGFLGGRRGFFFGDGGFRGEAGESSSGARAVLSSNAANGSGGGGGITRTFPDGPWQNDEGQGSGGGGHATVGQNGQWYINNKNFGLGGQTVGDNNLSNIHLGAGGGGGGMGDADPDSSTTGFGQTGGGIISINAKVANISSLTVRSVGGNGTSGDRDQGGGGAGAGGSVVIRSQEATLGTSRINVSGGARGSAGSWGGAGSVGRIAVYYSTSISGSTSPSFQSILDTSLAASDGHEIRLTISSNGTNEEIYSADITGFLNTGGWNRYSTVWQASTSTAKLFVNGQLINTATRSLTSIFNSSAAFAIGASFDGSGTAQHFLNGSIDDVRVFNQLVSDSLILQNTNQVLTGSEFGLQAYYEFSNDLTDSHTNANNLTGTGTPTYTSDVPFSGLSIRKDEDQRLDSSGQTYALTTTINEGATHRQTFVPQKDPQKSVIVNISAKGTTADWTLTIHDALNRVVAEKTLTNAELSTGFNEFAFDDVWTPVRGANYHFHLTVSNTTGTPAVVTGTTADLETAYFTTHYQFLINDEYHQMVQFLNFVTIANGRYIAKLEPGDIYDPHRITLPSTYRVRSLGYWREFLAIGTWRGESMTDYDQGRIFFWDGISDDINFYIDVPEGGINALKGTRGDLYFVAGYSGNLMVYRGGDRAEKVKVMPEYERGDTFEVHPSALTMWKSILLLGTGESTSETIERGVYSWGSLNQTLPESMNLEHITSLGVQKDENTELGLVAASGSNLYISWRNQNSFGLDRVQLGGEPYAQDNTYQTLITDFGNTGSHKLPMTYRVDFKPLREGEVVIIKYRRNRDDSFTELNREDAVGARYVRASMNFEVYEIEMAFDVECSNGTSPTIIGHGFEVDDARNSKQV